MWILSISSAWALAACDGMGTFERPLVDTATVSNPPLPPQGVQQGRPFEPSFVGWQFGGSFECDPNGQAAVIQIWEGVDDPCFELLQEGARVLELEVSDVLAGTYELAGVCTGPRSAGALFGTVQGGMLFLQRAEEGSVSLMGLDLNNVLEGAFSARFPTSVGFTSGGFRIAPHCLQLPLPVGGVGGGGTPGNGNGNGAIPGNGIPGVPGGNPPP